MIRYQYEAIENDSGKVEIILWETGENRTDCYPTKSKAISAFKRKKIRELRRLEKQLHNAKVALFLAMDERKFPS